MAVEYKCILICLTQMDFFRIFTLYAPRPDKIALTNGANESEVSHFQILRTF